MVAPMSRAVRAAVLPRVLGPTCSVILVAHEDQDVFGTEGRALG